MLSHAVLSWIGRKYVSPQLALVSGCVMDKSHVLLEREPSRTGDGWERGVTRASWVMPSLGSSVRACEMELVLRIEDVEQERLATDVFAAFLYERPSPCPPTLLSAVPGASRGHGKVRQNSNTHSKMPSKSCTTVLFAC